MSAGLDIDGLSRELLRKCSTNPVVWSEQLTCLDGERLDYSGDFRFWREPMKAVACSDSPAEHIWLFARGMGKTQQSARVKWYMLTSNPMMDCLYATPRMRQVQTFQKTVVRRMVNGSRGNVLKRLLDGNKINVQRNDLLPMPDGPGGTAEARCAWSDGDQIQGYHGHLGIADETQQWTRDALENLKNAIDKGDAKILFTGTPSYEGTTYHEYWMESDRREWRHRCPECGYKDHISLENILLVDTDPKRYSRFCMECEAEIGKQHILHNGFWEAEQSGVRRGYHFNQLISPRHDLDYIMREYNRPTTPEGDFIRYRLARFYSGAAKPIPEQSIQRVCDPDRGLRRVGERDRDYFVGVDFGGGEGSDTIAVVCHVTERREGRPVKLIVDCVELIEADRRLGERRELADLITRFDVPDGGRVCMDMGYGSEAVDLFQNGDKNPNQIPEHGWGSLVLGHRMSNVNRDSGEWSYMTLTPDNILKAYKPPWCNDVIRLFPDVSGFDDRSHGEELEYDITRTDDMGISIPYSDDGETREIIDYWTNQLTAVKREYKETRESGKKKEYFTTFGSNQKDDGFMALLYSYVAAVVGSTSSSGDELFSVGGMVG